MENKNDLSQKYNSFPSDFAPLEEKKSKKYGKDYAEAIYRTWLLNYPANNPMIERYRLNRQFAEGTYSTTPFRNRLGLNGDTSYLNLDFTSINRIPTIVDSMVGMALKRQWRFQCNPTDTVSKMKFDEYRGNLEAEMILRKFSDQVEQRTGVPLVPKDKYVPKDDEEKELHLQMNYKLDAAEAMEIALKWVFDNNNFIQDSLPQLIRDLIVDKKTCIMREYDENWNIKVYRWDHTKLITPNSVYPDYRDIPYQATIPMYTIGQLAKMYPSLTDQDLWTIAKNNAGQNRNALWNAQWFNSYNDYYQRYGAMALSQFNNFNIVLMKFYFLSPVTSTKAVRQSSKGRVKLDTVNDNYKSDKGVEVLKRRKLVRFEGAWIPNTEYVMDYKMTENSDRDLVQGGYSPETELPCKIIAPNQYDMTNKSDVERLIPFEKQLVLAWLKLQQFLIEAMPPGMAINQNALLDIVEGMGNGKSKPADWTKLYKQTGSFLFTDKGPDGMPINIPFKELVGGISPAFEQFIRVQDYCIQKMNEVVGFNTAVDASSPTPDSGLGVNQMAQQATYNSLRPLFGEAIRIIEATGKRVSLMIQDCIKFNNQAFVDAIGQSNVDVITMGKDMAFSTSAIQIEIQPDDEDMKSVEQLIMIGIERDTLTAGQVLRVRQQLKTNIKLAGQLLVYFENKNLKDKQQQALELQQQNGQVQIQSAQAASQAQAQLDAILTENKIAVESAKHQMEMEKNQAEFQKDMAVQTLKNEGAEIVAAINAGRAENVQRAVNEGKLMVEHIKHEGGMHKEGMKHASNMQQIELEAELTPKPKTPAKK